MNDKQLREQRETIDQMRAVLRGMETAPFPGNVSTFLKWAEHNLEQASVYLEVYGRKQASMRGGRGNTGAAQ